MPLPKTEYIWMNGQFVKWDDAKIHVLSHVVHYGSSWFEGARAYKTPKGTAVFRLQEHLKRLYHSVRVYHTELPYTVAELCDATLETVRRSGLDECYIRPFAYRGYNELGVYPMNCPVDVAIAVWEWGVYLGKDSSEKGVDVGVSSWNRITPNTMPSVSKAGGNYMNSQLVRIEAALHGYQEGLTLDSNGCVSEGSGENLFMVVGDCLYTPAMGAAILPGITRNTVITLAKELGIEVIETSIPRGMLYSADELFFTGTAVEITPIKSLDKITIGNGGCGPMTKRIQEKFKDIVCNGNDPHGWLTYVNKDAYPKNGVLGQVKEKTH